MDCRCQATGISFNVGGDLRHHIAWLCYDYKNITKQFEKKIILICVLQALSLYVIYHIYHKFIKLRPGFACQSLSDRTVVFSVSMNIESRFSVVIMQANTDMDKQDQLAMQSISIEWNRCHSTYHCDEWYNLVISNFSAMFCGKRTFHIPCFSAKDFTKSFPLTNRLWNQFLIIKLLQKNASKTTRRNL